MAPQKFTAVQPASLVLPDEADRQPSGETLARRRAIYDQVRELPDEAFTHLQYLQPQIGCFNRCVFCSQHAGTEVWQLSPTGLRDLFAVLHCVVAERWPHAATLGGDRVHKPRVLFPYVDNDIGSYACLDEYVRLVRDLFGGRVRLTTVGFSPGNARLAAMHRTIAGELGDAVAGMRLSVTPFTVGWGAGRTDTSRAQFCDDLAEVLAIYRPLADRLGTGKEAVSVEIRFRPLVATVPVTDIVVEGRHVIQAGPHLLVSRAKAGRPQPCRVVGASNNIPGRRDQTVAPEPVFSGDGRPYLHVVSDGLARGDLGAALQRVLGSGPVGGERREAELYRIEHRDGDYYACDPTFLSDGTMRSLMVFPDTPRRVSGYNDATRFFLQELLAHKRTCGYGRREEFPEADVSDNEAVLLRLRGRAADLAGYDSRAAAHLEQEVLPLISGYAQALIRSGLPASLFFSRRFTIDTGQAVNQGRGHVLFKGLLSEPDVPANPWEERAYLISHSKGYIWRIAPMPYPPGPAAAPGPGRHGRKNTLASQPSLVVEEIDPRHVQPRDFDTGKRLRRYQITGVSMEHLTVGDGRRELLFPGLLRDSLSGGPDAG